MKKYLGIISSLTLGLVIRLINLTGISLWHDEAFSALLIKYSFPEMIYRIGLDVHPPMYYIFLRFWNYAFGDSLGSLRGFSVFFGVALILVVYLLVKEIFEDEKYAILASILTALNPFQIAYVTEARMYTMGAFFGVLSALFLTKALKMETQKSKNMGLEKNPGKRILYYLSFSASISIIILTHYYLLFTALALLGYAFLYTTYLYRLKIKNYASLLLSYIFIVLAFSSYIPTFLFQFRQVGAGYWIPPIDRWSIPSTLWTLIVGIGIDINKSRSQILVSVITILVIWLIFNFLFKYKKPEKWLILLSFLAPFIGSLLFAVLAHLKGSNSSVYLVRYFLYSSPFLIIMATGAIYKLKQDKLKYTLLTLYAFLCLFSIYHFWDETKVMERPGMSAAAKYLKANATKDDEIIIGSSFEFFNYKYYNSRPNLSTGLIPKLYSGGTKDIHQLPHFAGTAILTNEDLLPELNSLPKGKTVWLLWTNGFGGSKPEIPSNFVQVNKEIYYPDVRPYVGTNIYVTQYIIK